MLPVAGFTAISSVKEPGPVSGMVPRIVFVAPSMIVTLGVLPWLTT